MTSINQGLLELKNKLTVPGIMIGDSSDIIKKLLKIIYILEQETINIREKGLLLKTKVLAMEEIMIIMKNDIELLKEVMIQ